jgi:DHA1 family inner membrane transport protein
VYVSPLRELPLRLERALFGRLPEDVRYNTRVELFASLAYGAFFAASIAFLPAILRRLGASTTQLALYITLTYLGQLLAPLSLTLLRGRRAMDFATIIWGIGRGSLVLALLIAYPEGLLLLAALLWIGETLPSPAYAQIIQQIYPPAFRGRAMSGVRVGMSVGVLILTPLAGLLIDRFGHQVLLPTAGFFGVLATVIFAYLRPVVQASPAAAALSAGGLLRLLSADRRFTQYLAAMTVYGLGGVMALPLYPVVQVSRLQLSYAQIGYLALVQSLFWLAGFIFWGRVLDKRGPVWVVRVAMLLGAAVPFCYIWATNIWLLLPAFMFQGLLQGAFDLGATNTAIELAEPGRVMEYTALQTAVLGLRGMIAPFLGAALLSAGLPDTWVFALCTLLVLAGAAMLSGIRLERTSHAG